MGSEMAERPWLDNFDDGVRPTLAPYPERTLIDYLDDLAAQHGSTPALLFKGASVDYDTLGKQSDAFAAALAGLGVAPGDRVALLLPNCPQFFVTEFGAWKAGAVVVALNPTYTERELERAIRATGATTIVTLTPFYEQVTRVAQRTSIERVIATSIKEYLPPLLRLLFTLLREKKGGHRIALRKGDYWLPALLRRYASAPRPVVTVAPGDRAVILSSGGTTGTPKGVVGLHRHYVTAGLQIAEWTAPARDAWTDVIMLPLPLFHVYANVGVQSLAFVAPNPLALVPDPRDIGDLLATIQRVRPSCFNGVPALYTAILNHPDVRAGRVDLSSIKLCVCGSAPLMADTRRQFEERTGASIVEGYALTESMMACCINPVVGANKTGSIGLPLPDVEVQIVDAELGEIDMATGEIGELILRAPQCMEGYWDDPKETTLALRPHGDGAPWLHTGDLAYMDDDGYLFIVDRKKDMVKTNGFQVWPREIEEVLSDHPAVLEAGVAGVPHPTKGEATEGWVVLIVGHQASEAELRDHCRAHLAPYKVPQRIYFRDALPKTLVGKVLRRALTADLPPVS
jgi:long-chain acyl-CoA synthetase